MTNVVKSGDVFSFEIVNGSKDKASDTYITQIYGRWSSIDPVYLNIVAFGLPGSPVPIYNGGMYPPSSPVMIYEEDMGVVTDRMLPNSVTKVLQFTFSRSDFTPTWFKVWFANGCYVQY